MAKAYFPRGIVIDTSDVPVDFETKIQEAFKEYTHGTNPQYMYQDKLGFIDCCVKYLHQAHCSNEAVKNLIKDGVEWNLDEYGDLPDKDDFWSIEFMEHCYEEGRKNAQLYGHYIGRHREDAIIMHLLYRAVKVVMDYKEEGYD